jgi:rRNA maturation endonuclease Nob1
VLNTIELVRTYETEYTEEDEDTGQTLSIPTNYLLYVIIIVLVIVVAALAFRGRTRISQATYCRNCGSTMPGKQKFCPKCGQKQE